MREYLGLTINKKQLDLILMRCIQIKYGCVYGYERKSRATEKRPNQHTKKKDCKAKVNFFCGVSAIKLTSVSEEHNHLRNSSIFQQETEKISGRQYFGLIFRLFLMPQFFPNYFICLLHVFFMYLAIIKIFLHTLYFILQS